MLLSSHILAEVQQVCDSATIIGHGRMLASGRVEDLIGAGTTYRVVVADPDAAARRAAGRRLTAYGATRRCWSSTPPSHPTITRALARGRDLLSELVPVRADLESVFLQLTEESTLGHGTDSAPARPRDGGDPMRLLAVELTRLRWRRAVVILLVGCVVIPALLWAGLAWSTRPVSDAEIQQAKEHGRPEQRGPASGSSTSASPARSDFGVPDGGDPEQLCQEYLGIGTAGYRWYTHAAAPRRAPASGRAPASP